MEALGIFLWLGMAATPHLLCPILRTPFNVGGDGEQVGVDDLAGMANCAGWDGGALHDGHGAQTVAFCWGREWRLLMSSMSSKKYGTSAWAGMAARCMMATARNP